ncbi:MAG: hypothetical protein LUD77_02020 [Clostridiales bacterium]|nr:hypothetical protein [Clostridiales bacterium]
MERAKHTLKKESETAVKGIKNDFAKMKRDESTQRETAPAFNKLKIDDFSRGLLVIEGNKTYIVKAEAKGEEITTVFSLLNIDDFSKGLLTV